MDALEKELWAACKFTADEILFNYHEAGLLSPSEIWTEEDRTNLATEYFNIAMRYVGTAKRYDEDPNTVLRAVNYLSGHAVPPLRDDTAWFRHGLHILIMLAHPVEPTNPKMKPFFADIRRGMKKAETKKSGS